MTPCKQTVFNFKNMPAEYLTLAAMLKPLRTRRKPPNPNKIIFLSDGKILSRMERPTGRMPDIYVLTMRMFPFFCTTRTS